jgi:hypothetical protein
VKIAEEGIYLGVPFGRPPGAVIGTAYYSRLLKFRKRMVRYAAHRNSLSIPHRIRLINLFSLPLLSYPFKFFLIPRNHGEAILSDIDGLLAKNNSFKTHAYTSPLVDMGPRDNTSLQNYWIQNLAALASRTTLEQVTDHPIMTSYSQNNKGKRKPGLRLYTWSMRFRTNRAIAAHFIQNTYGLEPSSFIGKHQSVIYKLIINSASYRLETQDYHIQALSEWGLSPEEARQCLIINGSLPHWVPPYVIFNHLHVVQKAISTTHKLAQIAKHAIERNSPILPHATKAEKCYLCGQGVDRVEHIFLDCSVTRKVNANIHCLLGTERAADVMSLPNLLHITFPLTKTSRETSGSLPTTPLVEQTPAPNKFKRPPAAVASRRSLRLSLQSGKAGLRYHR